MSMKAKVWFGLMSNENLLSWWWQYGEGRQAAFYRNAPRRKAWAEMVRRGLTPNIPPRFPRPRGYDETDGRAFKGWSFNWGIV
jgi:hypothetical protein